MNMDCRQNRTLRMAIENKFSLEQAKYGWLSTTPDGKATRLSKLRGVWKENLLRMAQFKSLMTPVLLVAFGMFIGALAISQVTRYHAAQKFLFYDTTVNFNLHSKPSNHIVPEVRNDVHPNASSNNYSQMRTESVIHPEVRNDVHPNASSNNYSQMRTESVIHSEVGNDIPSNASSSSDNVHTNASSSSIDNVDPNASSTDILHPINANSIDHTHPNASITNIHPNASMSKCIQPPTSEDWHWKGFPMQHNLTDAELFTMASIDPRVVGRPKKYIPKLAFMFLTHGPLPLRPLWEEFFKGHEKYFSIYVHSNPESTQDFEQPSFFHGRMIPSQDVKWGDISMMDAERRLLGNALLDFTNERFILLSETCIPLHNFSILYDYIIHSKHSFVGFTDDDGPVGKGRYNYNLEPEVTIDQFQKAPQWFEVNRKLALSIVKDTKYYSKFNSFCTEICYPDEHYIVTFLQIEYASELANRSLTAADWSRFEPHPLLYLEEDITYEFIKSLRDDISCSYNDSPRHICYMFARKFAQETLEPLLRLSHEVLFNG